MSIEWARLVIDVPIRPGDVDRAIALLRDLRAEIGDDVDDGADTFLEGPDVWGVQTLEVGVTRVRLGARVRRAVGRCA